MGTSTQALASQSLQELSSSTPNGSLYMEQAEIDGISYTIYLFFSAPVKESAWNELIVKYWILVLFVLIVAAVLVTNQFLTKFVFRKIEKPLDLLVSGVHEIQNGNLTYRIVYKEKDEFLPVFKDFNQMAERLQQSIEQIEREERNRKELIAGISHDIRSPLTSIQAYIEGLIDDIAKTPEKRKTYLYTIKNKAEDLERILSQLFLFSKMDLGEYPEHPCEIYLDDEIRKIVSDASEEFSEKGMTITEDLEHVEIYADPVQIQRIIINIMENSLKYKDKDEGRIEIKLRYTEDGCLLTIAVDGPGVPEQSIEHLFEVFYRSDSSRHNPERGSGLGLAIVANAVEHMGGKVWAENRNEEGLEIFIKIPTGGNENGKDTDN